MPTYAIYDTTTNAVRWLAVQASLPTPPAGTTYTEVPDSTVLNGKMDVVNGALVARTPTFSENQAAKIMAALAQYVKLMGAGFTWSGKLYQIDAASQANITAMGALALGSITDPTNSPWPSGFSWIAADNSQTAMDAAAMYGFARAVASYVSGCILNLRRVKTAIAAATTQAALDAIDIAAGYPAASA